MAQQQTQPQRTPKDPILTKIQEQDKAGRRKTIKTRARHSRIRKEFVGRTLGVFDGQGYSNVQITDDMVGRRIGKVAPKHAPTAQIRYLSIPARKMRRVAATVKGMPVEKALNVLKFTPKIAATHLYKAVFAAIANKLSIEGTAHLDAEHLVLSNIVVNEAPTAKRIRYRSMGRVYRLRKRYCHLAVYLDIDERKEAATVAAAEAKGDKSKAPAKKTVKKTATRKPAKKTPRKTAAKKKTTKKTVAKKTAAKKTGAGKAAKDDKKK